MASLFNLSTPFCITSTFTKSGYAKLLRSPINTTSLNPARLITCTSKETNVVPRRSGNFAPTLWDDRFIQSLTSVYSDETHKKKAEELKKEVRRLMIERAAARPLDQLELIDDLQRLGLSYHFEDIIETTLRNIYVKCNWKDDFDDLHATSIHFRLFRDHNFHVPQDVFVKFTDESGYLHTSLSTDIKGLLSLYEASHLSIEGETMLDHARDFSTQHLASHLKNGKMNHDDDVQTLQVKNALEVPLHWRMLRDQARWFIEEIYEQRPDVNPILLELAKLDFNIVQAAHQNDLKILSRWWKRLGVAQKAPFARERLFESFCGAMGVLFEPEESCCRQILAKTYVIITLLDDMCDVYATFDELVLFTDAVKSWDINTLDQLPEYMRIFYLALFNTVNDMAYDVLKDHGYNPIPQLKKLWGDLFESYVIEMRWYNGGGKPSLDEYLNVAWYSFSTPVSLGHVLFSATTKYPISKQVLEWLELSSSSSSSSNDVIHLSSLYLRLWDDLATSSDEMKRGDVPKSIQCYINETAGVNEEEARAHIKSLLSKILKKMNKARFEDKSLFSKKFIALTMNMCRMTLYVYQHGDAFGNSNSLLKDGVLKLLVNPIC